jgi:alpha-beta hydrolase superfamily lysophospholipase
MADTVEAVQIGAALGDKVLVISCSTGATLATWLGTGAEASKVNAHVFISPNFGLKNKLSELVNGHWGHQIAHAVTGDTMAYTPTDSREAVAWTTSYPTRAIFPMLALVKKVKDSDLSAFKTPVLVLYSAADQTVDPAETKEVFARLGSARKTLEAVTYSNSPGQHVLTGDIRDPQSLAPMRSFILDWLSVQ